MTTEYDRGDWFALLAGYASAHTVLQAARGANHRGRTPSSALLAERYALTAAEALILNYLTSGGVLAKARLDCLDRVVDQTVRMMESGLGREQVDSIIELQRAKVDSIRLAYDDSGDGPPLRSAADPSAPAQFSPRPRSTAGSGPVVPRPIALLPAARAQLARAESSPPDPADRTRP